MDDDVLRFKLPDAEPGEEKCDFCSGPHPTWDYPTVPFDYTLTLPDRRTVTQHDTGDGWGACDACSACIEADDYEALAERSSGMQMFRGLPAHMRTPKVEAKVLAQARAHVDHFRVHRAGPRVAAQK